MDKTHNEVIPCNPKAISQDSLRRLNGSKSFTRYLFTENFDFIQQKMNINNMLKFLVNTHV
ncbi:hypothetical protein BpHYR1_022486 [Brachionus plicatilis]|uniref:Uncharacterized protein n=1 Tax=Brachionus plicatilis TaxID=10195 RepID=A0A3M7Q123_BRAPC|nr:hypothetical protein BpHYR1_022486 [Brachionus plicatilis]